MSKPEVGGEDCILEWTLVTSLFIEKHVITLLTTDLVDPSKSYLPPVALIPSHPPVTFPTPSQSDSETGEPSCLPYFQVN